MARTPAACEPRGCPARRLVPSRAEHAERWDLARRRTACGLFASLALAAGARAEPVVVPGFGAVALVRQEAQPRRVVVLLSGGAGWDQTSKEMARVLASAGALVIGVDTRGYLRRLAQPAEGCVYPAGSFEELAQLVEKRLDYPRYATPFLAGIDAGAALAFAGIVESPVGTFAGLITLGFRPALATSRDLCAGRGLVVEPAVEPAGKAAAGSARQPRRVKPTARLEQPWTALHGAADADFTLRQAAEFVHQVPGARLVTVPRMGAAQGAPTELWEGPLATAFAALGSDADRTGRQEAAAQATLARPVADLPMLELPARGTASGTLAVVVSGDGGWNGIDRKVARVLSERGVAVAGLDSRRYFWTARTPAGAAADLERILRHYLAAWKCQDAVLVGYSFGADALPFMIDRLPAELLGRMRLLTLMSPGPSTRLEVFTKLKISQAGSALQVLPEMLKLTGRPILCLYGDREKQSLCPRLGTLAHAVKLPGSHAFAGNFDALVDHILAAAHAGATPRQPR
jgi:type IV secretory pathway VirJ component